MSDEIKIRNMLILDADREKSIKIKNDAFKIKAIFPKERNEIARRMAIEQNGMASNTFQMDDLYAFRRGSTVDTCVIDSPDWWENANDCIDEEVLDELYKAINKFSDEFQEKLKKNKFVQRDKKA